MTSEQDSEVSWNFLLRLMQDSVSPMDVMLILTALLMFISWVNPIIATAISREGGRGTGIGEFEGPSDGGRYESVDL